MADALKLGVLGRTGADQNFADFDRRQREKLQKVRIFRSRSGASAA
jgi:hypothetical protein